MYYRVSYGKDMLRAQISTPGVEQKNISVIYNKETDSLNIKTIKEPSFFEKEEISIIKDFENLKSIKYDFSKTHWTYKNGVIEITVPLKEFSLQKIPPSE